MIIVLEILSALLILLSVLQFLPNQHWIFRLGDFIKLQIVGLQVINELIKEGKEEISENRS